MHVVKKRAHKTFVWLEPHRMLNRNGLTMFLRSLQCSLQMILFSFCLNVYNKLHRKCRSSTFSNHNRKTILKTILLRSLHNIKAKTNCIQFLVNSEVNMIPNALALCLLFFSICNSKANLLLLFSLL